MGLEEWKNCTEGQNGEKGHAHDAWVGLDLGLCVWNLLFFPLGCHQTGLYGCGIPHY